MKILFISSTRLGDAVLSTGMLDYLCKTYPKSQITVAAGKLGIGLFQNFPNVVTTIPVVKKPYKGHWIELWKQCISTRWDLIVDLRGSAVSYLLCSKKRHVWHKKGKENLHKVEQIAKVAHIFPSPAPTLYFTKEQKQKAQELLPNDGFILGIGPAANWIGKSWHTERFIELLKKLRTEKGSIFENCYVAIFAAPGEEKLATPVLNSIEKEKQLDFIAKTSPEMAGSLLENCHFYIGNDSGLMHTAAACGTPTIGLFGPSRFDVYAPWGQHTSYARTDETLAELTSAPDYNPHTITAPLMDSLTVEKAYRAVKDLEKKLNL